MEKRKICPKCNQSNPSSQYYCVVCNASLSEATNISIDGKLDFQDKYFQVFIPNNPLDFGEKWTRLISLEGASALRKGMLSFNSEDIHLKSLNEMGLQTTINSNKRTSLKNIRIKQNAFSLFRQLIPLISFGTVMGIGVNLVILLRVGNHIVTDDMQTIGIGLVIIIAMIILSILFNLGKLTTSTLSIISLEFSQGKVMEFALPESEIDIFVNKIENENILVEKY
jgi:hypothetical protein